MGRVFTSYWLGWVGSWRAWLVREHDHEQQEQQTDPYPLATTLPHPNTPQYKKLYRIHLEQFPPNAKLHLQIVGVPERPDGLSALGTGAPLFKRTIAGSASGVGGVLNGLVADAEGNVDVSGWFWLGLVCVRRCGVCTTSTNHLQTNANPNQTHTTHNSWNTVSACSTPPRATTRCRPRTWPRAWRARAPSSCCRPSAGGGDCTAR